MRITAENTMALVIDFQEKLVPVIEHNEELLHNTQILIKGLQELQVPMIITQQYTKGIGMTVPALAELYGEGFAYEDKVTFSCVGEETILTKLKSLGKKNIIVCGIEAHICVLQTVIDLIALGYQVLLVEDCIGSRKESDRQVGIRRALQEGALSTSYESVLFELTGVARTDTFKAISRLIK